MTIATTALATPFEPGDTVDGWGVYDNEQHHGLSTTYGRVYMLEFDPAELESINTVLDAVTSRWQQHTGVTFETGSVVNSQGHQQIKVLLKAGSFQVFEHCDSAIRDAAILKMPQAELSPITSWFMAAQG